MCMKKCLAKKMFFGKVTPFNLAILYGFVFAIVVFFIDNYCAGVSNKHCLFQFSFHLAFYA